MVKNHLKSLNTPKTWNVSRKENTFVTRPSPGAHNLMLGFSLNHLMKNELGLTKTTKETKQVLFNKDCLVNGIEAKDVHLSVGFMDVISFPKIKKNYRITINKLGKLEAIEIADKDAKFKLSKVTNKTKLKGGKTQINTLDAKNILVDKDEYKTSSSLLLELPGFKISKTFELEKGSFVILTGGRHIGSLGIIESVEGNSVIFKNNSNDEQYETLKEFVFVLGKGKSEITVE